MRKLLLLLAILLVATNCYAVTEIGWTAAQQSNVTASGFTSDPIYLYIKGKVDGAGCQSGGNQFGLTEAWMYKITGTASYCDLAYSRGSDCISSASRDKVRDCFVPRALVYSICGDVIAGANKTQMESLLDIFSAKVSDGSFGTRPYDTDETIGNYFGIMIYHLARYGNLNNVPSNTFFGTTWGGVDCPAGVCSGIRRRIYRYFTELVDGEWMEGHRYNLNTLPYIVHGVNAINDFYGTDKFAEITALWDEMADNFYEKVTPTANYGQFYKWGDILSSSGRGLDTDSSIKAAMMFSYADNNNVNLKHLFDYLYTQKSTCHQLDYLGYYKHDVVGSKESGETSFNDSLGGLAYGHNGWGTGDIAVFSQMRPFFDVDHSWDAMQNWELWKNNNWIASARKHYYSNVYIDQSYVNGFLAYGAFSGMREARGQTAFEAGTNYLYHSGTTSGFLTKVNSSTDTDYNLNPFIDESTAMHLFRYNPDGSVTGFIYNRIKACNPKSTSCISSGQTWDIFDNSSSNLPYVNLLNGSSSDSDATIASHHMMATFDCQPVKTGDNWSCTDGSDTVEYHTFVDSYDTTDTKVIDMRITGNGAPVNVYNTSPYYFTGTLNPSEQNGYQLRIVKKASNGVTFYPFLNTIHIGTAADTYTEITASGSGSTEDVQGAMVENGTDRVVFLASAENKSPSSAFTSGYSGSGSPVFDSQRFNKAKAMSKFTQGNVVSFASNDTKNIAVFIVGLDTTKNWTITKHRSGATTPVAAGCTVSSQGVCKFTITGASDTHFITFSSTGNLDCSDVCGLCETITTCQASTADTDCSGKCCWHNNGEPGDTGSLCYDFVEPVVPTDDCDDQCSLCTTEGVEDTPALTCLGSAQTCYWHDNNIEANPDTCFNYPEPVVTTCNTSCDFDGCTEGTCTASTYQSGGCFWHDNDGSTSTKCNVAQERSVLCAAGSVAYCDTEILCEAAGFCWENGDCITTCTPTPTFSTVTLYPSKDTFIEEDTATTNYDTQGLKVISSVASGGSVSVNPDDFTAGGTNSSTITTSATRATHTALQDGHTAYLTKDYTASYFGDFNLTFTVRANTQNSDSEVGYACVSNTNNITMNGMNTANDGICFGFKRAGTDGWFLREYDTGSNNNSVVAGAAFETRYVTLSRSGSTCTAAVYTDSNRTIHASGSPITAACGSSAKRYLYLAASFTEAGASGSTGTGYIENVSINGVGSATGTDKVSLLTFDLSGIPAGSTIVAATLGGKSSATTSATATVYVFQGARDFTENQATWNIWKTSNNWTTAGARSSSDYTGSYVDGSNALASLSVPSGYIVGTPITFTSNASLTTLVSSNIGSSIQLVLMGFLQSTPQQLNIYDSEDATVGNRPYLTINYNPPTSSGGGTSTGGRRHKVFNGGAWRSGKFGG